MATSPVVARWELSRRLKGRRKELGVEVKTITDKLGFTRNYWSAVENDRTLIAEEKLRVVVELLQFDNEESQELLALRESGRHRGWWEDYPAFDDEMKRFLGLEDGASGVRAYAGLLFPGPLQTDDYATKLIEVDPAISTTDAKRALEIRQKRRRRLLHDGRSVHYSAIISEAALLQFVGDVQTQYQQLRHLEQLVEELPISVELRILPLAASPGSIVNSSTMTFFDYEQPNLPAIAYQESIRLLGPLEDQENVYQRLHLAWTDGYKRSLNRAQSLELIRKAAKTLSA